MTTKYLEIKDISFIGCRSKYVVSNKKSNTIIGFIEYYAPWRQYVYAPSSDTIYSAGCLYDIQKFIEGIKE